MTPPRSAADLLALVNRLRLTDPPLDAKEAGPADAAVEYAADLARRGDLTAFQADELLAGRGPGLVVGSYVVLEPLGAGGMGRVYRARHRVMGRVVALKVILPDLARRPDLVARFRQEIRAVADLSHPNLILAYHAEEFPGGLYLATEFCPGRDLGRVVAEDGPVGVDAACEYAAQVAAGLHHLAGRGLVHRDLKPSNLMLTGGTVKVLDFGLARLRPGDGEGRLTHAGAVFGTPDFLSPEQAEDAAEVDHRSDLYSLGCTLYYLLAGSVPYPGGTAVEKALRHITETPVPVERLRAGLPPRVAGVVKKLMARRPADRFQSAAELMAALEPLRAVPAVAGVSRGAFGSMAPPSTGAAPPFVPVRPDPAPARTPPGPATSLPPKTDSVPTPAPASRPDAGTVAEEHRPPRRRKSRRPAPSPRPHIGRWVAAGVAVAAIVVAAVIASRPERDAGNPTTSKDEHETAVARDPAVKPAGRPDPGGSAGEAAAKPQVGPSGGGWRPVVGPNPTREFAVDDPALAGGRVGRLSYSPDSSLVAVTHWREWYKPDAPDRAGAAYVWNPAARTYRPLFPDDPPCPPVFAVAFSRDGRFLACGAGSLDAEVPPVVTVFSTETWDAVGSFRPGGFGVTALAFPTYGSRHLFVGTRGPGGVEVWASDGWAEVKRVATWDPPGGPVNRIAFDPGKTTQFTAAQFHQVIGQRVFVPEKLTGDPIQTGVWLLDPANRKGVGGVMDAAYATVTPNVSPPNSRWLAAVTKRLDGPNPPAQVLAWDLTRQPVAPPQRAEADGYDFTAVAPLPGGRGFVTGDAEGKLRVWGVGPLKQQGNGVKLFQSQVFGLAVSPDGSALAAGGAGEGGTARVVLVPTKDLPR